MKRCIIGFAVLALLITCQPAMAGLEMGWYDQGSNSLTNTADYEWWYGCSPTSAGMMMGYYDRNGYAGLTYENLVPGGTAESTTYPPTANWDALAKSAIASQEHVDDFWTGYGNSGDDPLGSRRTNPDDFNCLADFMGTSQDSPGANSDGSTSFWFYGNGTPYTAANSIAGGHIYDDGMLGIGLYVEDVGYSYGSLYTQLTDNDGFGYGFSGGFTFEDFKNEIDNDRIVMIHVMGHSMVGYAYDDSQGNVMSVYDTWSSGGGTMAWGGGYPYGTGQLDLWGVTVLEVSGGDQPYVIPEPSSVIVWSLLGCVGMVVGYRRRRRT